MGAECWALLAQEQLQSMAHAHGGLKKFGLRQLWQQPQRAVLESNCRQLQVNFAVYLAN